MNRGRQGVQFKSVTSVEALKISSVEGTGPGGAVRTVWSQPAELLGRAVTKKGGRATKQTVQSKSSRLGQQVVRRAKERDDFPTASICRLVACLPVELSRVTSESKLPFTLEWAVDKWYLQVKKRIGSGRREGRECPVRKLSRHRLATIMCPTRPKASLLRMTPALLWLLNMNMLRRDGEGGVGAQQASP